MLTCWQSYSIATKVAFCDMVKWVAYMLATSNILNFEQDSIAENLQQQLSWEQVIYFPHSLSAKTSTTWQNWRLTSKTHMSNLHFDCELFLKHSEYSACNCQLVSEHYCIWLSCSISIFKRLSSYRGEIYLRQYW